MLTASPPIQPRRGLQEKVLLPHSPLPAFHADLLETGLLREREGGQNGSLLCDAPAKLPAELQPGAKVPVPAAGVGMSHGKSGKVWAGLSPAWHYAVAAPSGGLLLVFFSTFHLSALKYPVYCAKI